MKAFLICLLIITTSQVKAQRIEALDKVSGSDTVGNDKAIIYGSFIQRLGFTSGGYPQDIRIKSVENGKFYSFRVKPTFKSAKENTFCFYLEPGTYRILNYWWTQSKWYGAKMFTEGIAKSDGSRYTFTVEKNTVVYLGTWHFDTETAAFTNDKSLLDDKIKGDYKNLNFNAAISALPQ